MPPSMRCRYRQNSALSIFVNAAFIFVNGAFIFVNGAFIFVNGVFIFVNGAFISFKMVPSFLSYFFVKKIPLSRRVEYVMDGSTDQ